MKIEKLIKRLRIDDPDDFRLADFEGSDTCGIDFDKHDGEALLAKDIARLTALQERLYAQDTWALLIVLQGMDTCGKDGVIKHVMSGVNPQGCQVHSFKAPSGEELEHDFLWRAATRLPGRGRIGIFNRSHYEEVLVVRVHPELLERQKLPKRVIGKSIWKHRYKDIRAFERHLDRNGVRVLKFFLHISKEEQRQRLLARVDEPAKRWKFSMNDIAERERWDDYMHTYQDMVRATSREEAPWYVVPANHKWFARLVVASTIVAELERLDLQFPKVEGEALKEIQKVRAALAAPKEKAPKEKA